MGHRFCKNWLLGTEGAKISVELQKGPLGGPKSENPLYLSNYDSVGPKNWDMVVTVTWIMFTKLILVLPNSSEYFLMFGH